MKARYLVLTIAIIVVTVLSLNGYVFSQVSGKSRAGAEGMSMKQGSAGLEGEAGGAGEAGGREEVTASMGADDLVTAEVEPDYPDSVAREEAEESTEESAEDEV